MVCSVASVLADEGIASVLADEGIASVLADEGIASPAIHHGRGVFLVPFYVQNVVHCLLSLATGFDRERGVIRRAETMRTGDAVAVEA